MLETNVNDEQPKNKTFLQNYPLAKAFLAGSFSGTFSTILFQPLDLVKTRLQNPTSAILNARAGTGMVTIFATIVQQEHLRGLWRGMAPSITRCVPGVGLYFCSLDYLKTKFFEDRTPGALQSVALGMFARCMSGVALIPITVVKTRYESGVYGYNGVASALKEIYKTEGFKGMTCGLIPTLFRDAPFSGLYLMFYTQSKQMIPEDLLNTHYATPMHFTCGITAGILASVVTQPADVLKTKMQLYPNKFNGIWSVMVYVHGKYGVQGYFKGMVPRMLRRTLMAAMAWTVYESITKSIGLK
ncbi:PREDICTED: solute carrier family 25 member 38-A-like isoform X1 [Nicrophorus vespilloides]|uniref:Mitochondrial glycine transporter n=1 Tax=Nicrophorus vespilloides TaxID=110193 RepID=A0ABM1MRT8_NICVS|nr:PREDICTED: solute carrier family 25 member 38-A-like isoform X1 [Nicrophorus vespilloides]